jgi:hypothetical protein
VTFPLASLGDWADAAGIAGAVIGVVGLAFVVVQLRSAAAAARTQATIQFQQAFRDSRGARFRLLASFPVHAQSLGILEVRGDEKAFPTWSELTDLSDEQKKDAHAVVNALNDVAQYVADGLSLRSALQQYHTIFVRAGFLLAPYIDKSNEGGAARWGVRVIELFNAGLRYHRAHPKHREKELLLKRDDPTGVLVLIRTDGGGLPRHRGYALERGWSRRVVDALAVRLATRGAERKLRR